MLGLVYACFPQKDLPTQPAEHVCICVVEMGRDVSWGPEEETVVLQVARERKRYNLWGLQPVNTTCKCCGSWRRSSNHLREIQGSSPSAICQALEVRRCCMHGHATTSL